MSERAERLGAAALTLIASLAVVYMAWKLRDDHVGDATIYLAYAENAGDGHLFQFNRGEFSSGSTSPLWSLILGVPFVFGGGIGAAKVVAALFAVLAVLACVLAAQRVSGSWLAGAAAGLFVPGAMTYYPVSLYESGLVIALGALAVVAGLRVLRRWEEDGRLTPGAAWPLALVWALLPLSRPDATVLVAIEALALLVLAPVSWRRALGPLAATLAAAAVPAAAYFGYSTAELGTPSTSSDARSFALEEVGRKLFGPFYRNADAIRELLRSPWIVALLPAAAGVAMMARRRERRWVALWAVLAVGAYVFLLTFVTPGLVDSPRYLLPIVPLVVCGVAYLLAHLPGPALRAGATAVAVLVLGIATAAQLDDDLDLIARFDLDEREVFSREPTDIVNRMARPGDVLLSYEVQLRYFLRDDVEVLSQDGIIDGKVRDYQPSRDLTAFMLRYRPDWWIGDQNVDTRPYLRGTVLERAFDAFKADPRLRSRTLDGIRFDLVERRRRPLQPGFGGWQMLFRVSYPEAPA